MPRLHSLPDRTLVDLSAITLITPVLVINSASAGVTYSFSVYFTAQKFDFVTVHSAEARRAWSDLVTAWDTYVKEQQTQYGRADCRLAAETLPE